MSIILGFRKAKHTTIIPMAAPTSNKIIIEKSQRRFDEMNFFLIDRFNNYDREIYRQATRLVSKILCSMFGVSKSFDNLC